MCLKIPTLSFMKKKVYSLIKYYTAWQFIFIWMTMYNLITNRDKEIKEFFFINLICVFFFIGILQKKNLNN